MSFLKKLGNLGRKTKGGFVYDVIKCSPQAKDRDRHETTVLKLINTKCLECLMEARKLGELLQHENIQLVGVMLEAPRLDAYLKGGLYGWHLVTDFNNLIAKNLNLNHPSSHSTYIISQGEVVASFKANHWKSLVEITNTLHLINTLSLPLGCPQKIKEI